MILVNSGKHISKSIYGIIVTATLLFTLEGHESSAWVMVFTIISSVFAVSLSEFYSTMFGRQLDKHAKLTNAALWNLIKNCLYMFYGSLFPVFLFVLAALGVIDHLLAFELAEAYIAIFLLIYGYIYGKISNHSSLVSIMFGLINASIVLLIVYFKYLLHV